MLFLFCTAFHWPTLPLFEPNNRLENSGIINENTPTKNASGCGRIIYQSCWMRAKFERKIFVNAKLSRSQLIARCIRFLWADATLRVMNNIGTLRHLRTVAGVADGRLFQKLPSGLVPQIIFSNEKFTPIFNFLIHFHELIRATEKSHAKDTDHEIFWDNTYSYVQRRETAICKCRCTIIAHNSTKYILLRENEKIFTYDTGDACIHILVFPPAVHHLQNTLAAFRPARWGWIGMKHRFPTTFRFARWRRQQ